MTDEKLIRGISRWDLAAITINTIIGAGIFGLPSKITALIGSYSLVAFVVCALIVAFIVLCFAEVSSRFQTTGGSYLYAHEAFGSVVGFEVGWLYWIVRVTTFAANCNLLLSYLGFFFPSANEGATRVLLIALIVLILTAAGAVLILIYAFVGFEAATIPAGEVRNPQRSVPFALMTALVIVAVLYILIQVVAIGTLPELAASERPLADAANKFLGSFGAAFITIGALVSIFGNLNGGFLTASRVPFAMAEHNELPRIFARTHEKFKTPHISLFITALAMLVLTIQSSFITALTISTITRLIVYATTCAALPVFRYRQDSPKAEFLAPLGIAASVLSLVLTVWLLTNVDFRKEGLAILIVAVLGLIIYFAYRAFKEKKSEESL
ncbi:MAG: amino acid permease [Acidobacteria bacterium]|nr:amino acid permease [Acidobacteriota bacterium]